jgi:putative transposase
MPEDSQNLIIPRDNVIFYFLEPLKALKNKGNHMKSIQQKSNHTTWECKYHIVWIPKYRKKRIYKELRQYLGEMIRDLARQKECKIEEGHLMSDHVHILISIPPKYSVAKVVGFLKGKSAIAIARTYMGRRKNFTGQHFWARGYHVSTVGRDEAMIRAYIKHQESEDLRIDQLDLY